MVEDKTEEAKTWESDALSEPWYGKNISNKLAKGEIGVKFEVCLRIAWIVIELIQERERFFLSN